MLAPIHGYLTTPPNPATPPAPPHGPMVPWPYASTPDQMTLSDDFKGTHGSWQGPSACLPCACSALPTRSARPSWPHPFGPYGPMAPGPMASNGSMAPSSRFQGPQRTPILGPMAPAPWPHGPLWACASRSDQMTLKGSVYALCPLCLLHPPSMAHASMAPWPTPYFVAPGPMAPWSPGHMPLDPIK